MLLMIIGIMAAISSAQKSANQEWKLSSDSKIKWSENCDFVGIKAATTWYSKLSHKKSANCSV